MSSVNNLDGHELYTFGFHFNFGRLPLELQEKIVSTVHNQDVSFVERKIEAQLYYDDQGQIMDYGFYGRGTNALFMSGNKHLSTLATKYVFKVSLLVSPVFPFPFH